MAPTPFNTLRCFWALLDPTVCLSPFHAWGSAHATTFPPGWLVAAGIPEQRHRLGWCHGMGSHHVGSQQTLLLSALGINGFQDTAWGFNFVSSKKKGNLSRKCRDTHDTGGASGCEMRLFRNCQSGFQCAHRQLKQSRRVSAGNHRANRLCLLLETVQGCCAGKRTMQRHVIAGLRHPQ